MGEEPEIEAKREEVALVISTARQLKVTDSASYAQMANAALFLRQAVKYFEDLYRPRIQQADAVTKGLREDMRRLQSPALEAQRLADAATAAYRQEQERKAREEKIRVEQEQRRREEEERLQLAQLAEQAGDKQLADEILETPIEKPPVTVSVDVPKIEGLSFREDWKFEVTDAAALPREYLTVDDVKIGKIVRALKETCSIPGVRVYSVKTPIGRG